MRTRFSILTSVAGTVMIAAACSPAAAQATLERIADAIREQHAAAAPAPAAQPVPAAREPGYLGAMLDDRADRGRGVRVVDLRPASPAAQAGLQKNDLITAIANMRVREMRNLADILAVFKPGDTVAIDVLRGNQAQQIKVTLGQRPAATGPLPPAAPTDVPAPGPTPADGATRPPIPPEPLTPVTPPALGPELGAPSVPREPPAAMPPTIEPPVAEPPAQAPPTDVAEQNRLLIGKLQRRIDELEERIAALEKALAEKANP